MGPLNAGMQPGQCAIQIEDDAVAIIIRAKSKYEAEVLYDDLIERMKSGEGVSVALATALADNRI